MRRLVGGWVCVQAHEDMCWKRSTTVNTEVGNTLLGNISSSSSSISIACSATCVLGIAPRAVEYVYDQNPL